ncbi:MAG: DUF4279 domain-containing protein [Microvirga sp.]
MSPTRTEVRLGTSSMKSEKSRSLKAFATLRFAGDMLDPEELTLLLGIAPTRSYKKGERYHAGSRSDGVIGKTGVWYFSTDGVVRSGRLQDHLRVIADLIVGEPTYSKNTTRVSKLRRIVDRCSLRPVVTCFWHGSSGAKAPTIPRAFQELIRQIHGFIETDFDVDIEESRRPRFAQA